MIYFQGPLSFFCFIKCSDPRTALEKSIKISHITLVNQKKHYIYITKYTQIC